MTVQNTTFLLKYLTEQQYSNVFFIGEGWSSVAFRTDDFIHGIIGKYQELSSEKFDIEHLKKLYFLRNIYLLYWAHRKSKLTSEVLSYKVTDILHKVSR